MDVATVEPDRKVVNSGSESITLDCVKDRFISFWRTLPRLSSIG